jgi:predicted CoA-binding protein
MNEQLIASFLDKKNIFAIVGVSRDPAKYGHQVYKNLRSAGYKVYAINPNANEILGDKCYPSLEALPVKPDVVNIVVPPIVTETVVKTCKKLGIKKVWMQPGSESEAAINFCRKNGIDVIYGVCVMIEQRKRQKEPEHIDFVSVVKS